MPKHPHNSAARNQFRSVRRASIPGHKPDQPIRKNLPDKPRPHLYHYDSMHLLFANLSLNAFPEEKNSFTTALNCSPRQPRGLFKATHDQPRNPYYLIPAQGDLKPKPQCTGRKPRYLITAADLTPSANLQLSYPAAKPLSNSHRSSAPYTQKIYPICLPPSPPTSR